MTHFKTPEKKEWDVFWDGNLRSRFTRSSWSKKRILGVLDHLLFEGMEVLDAGCGSGFFSNFFLSRNCKVCSLDYSIEALNMTRMVTNGRSSLYLKEDLRDETIGSHFAEKFDLIFTDGLFEHFGLNDQQRIMNNFKSVKKRNGMIATFVPNRWSWWTVVRPFFMPGIEEMPFTIGRLRQLHSGLEITREGGINVLPLPLSPDEAIGKAIGMILFVIAK